MEWGHDAIRVHPHDGAERAAGARRVRAGGRGARVRLRRVERPLLAVAHGAGALAERVGDARRGGAGDGADPAHDPCDLPDDAVPPGGRRPAGGDAAAAQRGALPTQPRLGREPQRARRRRRLAECARAPGDAARGDHRHPGAAHGRTRHVGGRVLPGRLGPRVGSRRRRDRRRRVGRCGDRSVGLDRRPHGRHGAVAGARRAVGRGARPGVAQDRPGAGVLGADGGGCRPRRARAVSLVGARLERQLGTPDAVELRAGDRERDPGADGAGDRVRTRHPDARRVGAALPRRGGSRMSHSCRWGTSIRRNSWSRRRGSCWRRCERCSGRRGRMGV